MTADDLMKQAPTTVDFYLARAVLAVEKQSIPKDQQGVVIAAYLAACVADFDTAMRHFPNA